MARDVYLEGNDDGISRRDFLKKLGYGVGGLFAGGALLDSFSGDAYAGEMVAQKEAEASVPQKKDYIRVVVLDFEHSGHKRSVYSGETDFTRGIPDQLIAELEGSNIRVIDRMAIMAALRKNGYTWEQFSENPWILDDFDGVIAGSYTLNSGDLTIVSKYIDRKTGTVMETQKVTGWRQHLNELVDQLGDEVIHDLGKYTNKKFEIGPAPEGFDEDAVRRLREKISK